MVGGLIGGFEDFVCLKGIVDCLHFFKVTFQYFAKQMVVEVDYILESKSMRNLERGPIEDLIEDSS